jgi:hypothetical protein
MRLSSVSLLQLVLTRSSRSEDEKSRKLDHAWDVVRWLAQIVAAPGRAFTSFRFLPFYRDAFRVLVLGKSPDEVARLNGWRFHTDGVHLNPALETHFLRQFPQ